MPGYVRYRGSTTPRHPGEKVRHKWQARWRHPDTGVRREKQVSHTDKQKAKRAAERWMAEREDEALLGKRERRNCRLTFAEVVERWRDTWVDIEPRTRSSYESILHNHLLPEFGKTPVMELTPEVVQAFIAKLAKTKAPNTVRRIVGGTLLNALNSAIDLNLIDAHPCPRVKLPKARQQRKGQAIFEADITLLIAALPAGVRLYTRLAAYTGARSGELCGIRRRDVDLVTGRIHIRGALKDVYGRHVPEAERGRHYGDTKNHETRVVAVAPDLLAELRRHLMANVPADRDAYVFAAPAGAPFNHGNFYRRVFLPTVRKLWPEPDPRHGFRFHDLRHSCASMLAASGLPQADTQAILGHKTAAMTSDIYTHAREGAAERAAAAISARFAEPQVRCLRGLITDFGWKGHGARLWSRRSEQMFAETTNRGI